MLHCKKICEPRLIALPMGAQQRHLRNPAPQRMQKREDVNSGKLFNIKYLKTDLRVAYTVTCVPTSTTRPVGIWKKSVASLADRARAINK
jgi:hypothetical protein